jgi:hypothetical protein
MKNGDSWHVISVVENKALFFSETRRRSEHGVLDKNGGEDFSPPPFSLR